MKSTELIADLALCGSQDLVVTLNFLADRVSRAELADGQHLRDATDFAAWLRELAAASEDRTLLPTTDMRIRLQDLNRTCPRCGHIHQGDQECGTPIGGGRTCRCEMEGVPA